MVLETAVPTRRVLPGGIDPLQLVPAREFDRLVLLLTHAERGAWAFCLYNTAAVRDAIVEALRARLDPLPVYEFALSPEQPNPRNYLRRLPPGAADRRAIVVFYDAWRAFDHDFFGYLDLQREQFMKFPHSLVFWVRDADRAAIARYAPNFFSRHAGVFDFQVTVPEQAQALRDLWAGEPIGWDSVEERKRQERLYVGLLAEYEADEEPDQAVIADLLGKLARIWYYSAQYDEAEAAVKRRLDITRKLGDRAGEANSLRLQGWIAVRGYDMDQALASYEQALGLFRAVGSRLGEANTLQAIGDVHNFRKELDQALASYEQALGLFRAVGDRLGEANVFLALGRLARGQGDLQAARAHAQTALAAYRAMGDAWDTALALWDLGRVERDAGNPSAAQVLYQEALTLLERIGAPAAADLREELRALSQGTMPTQTIESVTLADIQQIVQQIVERFHPRKVILFGSYADGAPTEDSDVDLLVVMETDEQPLHAAAQIAAAIDHPFPLDILVLRPTDWEEYLTEKAVFVMDVATNGVVLYEARH